MGINPEQRDAPTRTIVYVTDGLSPWVIGGMQTVARRHIGWLVEAGYHVTVVHGMAEDVQIDGLDMIRIPWPSSGRVGRLSPWKYANELRRFSRDVGNVIDQVSPALVYGEGPVLTDYLARPRATRVPTVFHPHGLEMYQHMGSRFLDLRVRPLRGLMRLHAMKSDQVISQGGRLTAILQSDLGVPPEKLAHIPNCLPYDFPKASVPRTAQKRRFLFVGRPERRKGLHLLLDIFRGFSKGATLDVAGSTGESIDQRENVVFHGVVREKDMLVSLFDQCDYLVMPSSAEGMATVLLEALGRAMPVIATDVGATRDLVLAGRTGWLVAAGDRSALTTALRAADNLDDHSYAAMSRRAIDITSGEFSPETVRKRFLALIAAETNDSGDQ